MLTTEKGIRTLEYLKNEMIAAGFRPANGGSALVKTGGAASLCVSFPAWSPDTLDGVLTSMENSSRDYGANPISTHVAYSYIFLDEQSEMRGDPELVKRLKQTVLFMNRQGAVCEMIVVNTPDAVYTKVGGGNPLDRSLKKCLDNAMAELRSGETDQTPEKKQADLLARKASLRNNFGRDNYPLMYGIIALNAGLFLAGLILGLCGKPDFITAWGIQDNELIRSGEYWRLVTAMFLHSGLAHLAGNMLSLYYLGRILLPRYTKGDFLLLYLVSGFFGNVLSFFFVKGLSLGASGAVMGLGGALIFKMFFSYDKQYFRNTGNYASLALMVAYNLFFGVFATFANINNFAHFGGFISGFLIAWIFEKMQLKRAEREGQ